MKRGKNYLDSVKLYDKATQYDVEQAVELCLQTAKAKFDETIELSVRLGVDPRHADQQVRGAVVLPHGTGKTVRVLVFAKGDKVKEAEDAGADYVGAEELAQKIQTENWFDFDVCVATLGYDGRCGPYCPYFGTKRPDAKPQIWHSHHGCCKSHCGYQSW